MNQTFVYDETAIMVIYMVTFGLPLLISLCIGFYGITGNIFLIVMNEEKLTQLKMILLLTSMIIFDILGLIVGLFISIVYVSPYILVEGSSDEQVVIGRFMMVQTGMCIVGIITFISGIVGTSICFLIGYSFICCGYCLSRFLEVYKCYSIINCCGKWRYIITGEKIAKEVIVEMESKKGIVEVV